MTPAEAEEALSIATTRSEAAETYAACLRAPFGINWSALNRVILRRWSMSGLKYVKALAWKLATADDEIKKRYHAMPDFPEEKKGLHLNG